MASFGQGVATPMRRCIFRKCGRFVQIILRAPVAVVNALTLMWLVPRYKEYLV